VLHRDQNLVERAGDGVSLVPDGCLATGWYAAIRLQLASFPAKIGMRKPVPVVSNPTLFGPDRILARDSHWNYGFLLVHAMILVGAGYARVKPEHETTTVKMS
jgi:hypothetical protein